MTNDGYTMGIGRSRDCDVQRRRCGCARASAQTGSCRAAFTLVEMLIVLLVVAILASVALLISDSCSSKLRGAAVILARDLEYVQAEAINTGRTLRVEFVSSTRYRAMDVTNAALPSLLRHPQDDYPAHNNQFIVDFNDPGPLEDVRIASASFSGTPQLEFGKYGEPAAGGEVTLTSGGYQVRVIVAPVTGLVTISDLEAAPKKVISADAVVAW